MSTRAARMWHSALAPATGGRCCADVTSCTLAVMKTHLLHADAASVPQPSKPAMRPVYMDLPGRHDDGRLTCSCAAARFLYMRTVWAARGGRTGRAAAAACGGAARCAGRTRRAAGAAGPQTAACARAALGSVGSRARRAGALGELDPGRPPRRCCLRWHRAGAVPVPHVAARRVRRRGRRAGTTWRRSTASAASHDPRHADTKALGAASAPRPPGCTATKGCTATERGAHRRECLLENDFFSSRSW